MEAWFLAGLVLGLAILLFDKPLAQDISNQLPLPNGNAVMAAPTATAPAQKSPCGCSGNTNNAPPSPVLQPTEALGPPLGSPPTVLAPSQSVAAPTYVPYQKIAPNQSHIVSTGNKVQLQGESKLPLVVPGPKIAPYVAPKGTTTQQLGGVRPK